MKNYILLLFTSVTCLYAQLTGTVESQKYKANAAASFYPGFAQIGDDEMAIGSFITDLDGNIKRSIPSYMFKSFEFTKSGVYVFGNLQGMVGTAFVFLDYSTMNSVSNLKGIKQVVAKDNSTNYYPTAKEVCYITREQHGFVPSKGNISDYAVQLKEYKLQIFLESELHMEIDLNVKGIRLDQLYTSDGIFYALYSNQKKLVLVKVDLKSGKDEYVNLDTKYDYFPSGKLEIVGDKLYLSAFQGEGEGKGVTGSAYCETTANGLISMVVNTTDMSITSRAETDIPSEYLDLLGFSKNELKGAEVINVANGNSGTYILTTSYFGAQGPIALWKFSGNEIKFVNTISAESSKYGITSSRVFNYNGVTYVLYVEDNIFKMVKTNGSDLEKIDLTIEPKMGAMAHIDLSYIYVSKTGMIMLPAFNNVDTGYLLKIQL